MKYICNECGSVFDENYLVKNIITGEGFCPICSMPTDLYEDVETRNYTQFRSVLENNISV